MKRLLFFGFFLIGTVSGAEGGAPQTVFEQAQEVLSALVNGVTAAITGVDCATRTQQLFERVDQDPTLNPKAREELKSAEAGEKTTGSAASSWRKGPFEQLSDDQVFSKEHPGKEER